MKGLLLLTVLLVLLTCPDSSALPRTGFAPYGLTSKSWNFKLMKRKLARERRLRVSFLYNTFGPDLKNVKKLLSDPRLELLEVFLLNGPGLRNLRLGEYEFLYGETINSYRAKLRKKDKKFLEEFLRYLQPLADLFNTSLLPQTRCIITITLETNATGREENILYRLVKPLFPARCEFAWSPGYKITRRAQMPRIATILEGHGLRPPLLPDVPCIVNSDGAELNSGNVEQFIRRHRRCEAVFLWTPEMNCIEMQGPWLDPRTRTHCPDSQVWDFIGKYLR